MRRAPIAIQPAPAERVGPAERLRAAAARLAAMAPDAATSLSVTTGWHGESEADIRRLARAVAATAGLGTAVDADGDVVTIRFWRTTERQAGAH